MALPAAVFGISCAVTLPLLHWLLERAVGRSFYWHNLFRGDLLWPTFALVSAVTFANYVTLPFLTKRTGVSSSNSPSIEPTDTPADVSPMAESQSRDLERLNRSAERLDMVEQDLIRKISDTFTIDSTTQHLLTEMRICTNRLRGQLSDIKRPLDSHVGNSQGCSSGTRQSHDELSPCRNKSDVKFDNVPVA